MKKDTHGEKFYCEFDEFVEQLKQNGYLISSIPKKFKNFRIDYLIEIALKENGLVITDLPIDFITIDVLKIAIKSDVRCMLYISEKVKIKGNMHTQELYDLVVEQLIEQKWNLPDHYGRSQFDYCNEILDCFDVINIKKTDLFV